MRKASYLTVLDTHLLSNACRPILEAFQSAPYLVGGVMRPGEPTYHTQPVRWWRVDVNDWKAAPHQAWFTSSAAADRYVAGYAPDVLRHAVTVVGPVEVEER